MALPKRNLVDALERHDVERAEERSDWQEENERVREKQLDAEQKLLQCEIDNNEMHQNETKLLKKIKKLRKKLKQQSRGRDSDNDTEI